MIDETSVVLRHWEMLHWEMMKGLDSIDEMRRLKDECFTVSRKKER
jgi:hypothetical protein